MSKYDESRVDADLLSEGTTANEAETMPKNSTGEVDAAHGQSEEKGQDSSKAERTASDESQPRVIDLSNITAEAEEKVKLGNFQRIAAGFFAQTKEPAFTINVDKVGANAAAVRLFPDVDYMEILINPNEKKVALKPCDELNLSGYRWAKTKDGKRYSTQRTGLPFVLCVCRIMGWNPNNRFRILGKKVRSDTDEEILLFDLNEKQEFKRTVSENGKKGRSTILTGWNGIFGPSYDESQASLHVDKFEEFTVFSIRNKGKKQEPQKAAAAEGQDSYSEEGTATKNE